MTDTGPENPPVRTPAVPDFTQEALAHLQVQSDTFASHVNAFLDVATEQNRQQLSDDLLRFRNTLVLLEKGAAVYVAEELIALLDADARGELSNRDEVKRVLLLAADQLSEHVALLQRDGSLDSALPMLPLVNDSRACRDESLLSDMLVLAAGIALPPIAFNSIDKDEWLRQRDEWVVKAGKTHALLAKNLLSWWRKSDNENAHRLAKILDALADFCQQRNYLVVLVPLFQSASLVATAIANNELNDGPALRSLFAQLERSIHRGSVIATPDDLLPGDLLRNYLYYVAQIETNEPAALKLRHQFRLDRVRQAARVNETRNTPTIGVGYHLARAIRSNISTETESLRNWLDQTSASVDHPVMVRLRVRLAQLEPVLTLMGEPEALTCLRTINAELAVLEDATQVDPDSRLRLAESLLSLDALLAESARYSVTRRAAPEEPSKLDGDDVFVDMATDACLRVARESLQEVATKLAELMKAGPLSPGRCHAVTQQILLIDQALQILPLPQISPLLRGLDDILSHVQIKGRGSVNSTASEDESSSRVQQEIATLLVSIDYYLGCALQPGESAEQLLAEAQASLQRAHDELQDGADGNSASEYDEDTSAQGSVDADQFRTEHERHSVHGSEHGSEQGVALFLPHMDALGNALVNYRRNTQDGSTDTLKSVLFAFEQESERSSSESMQELSSAAYKWFSTLADQIGVERRRLTNDELALLDEVHGVIPQLIDQWLSDSESIRAFDELIERLQQEPDSSLNLHDVGGLTLNVDDELLLEPVSDSDSARLDSTLRLVFYHECTGHLDELEQSVKSALQPSAGIAQRLPTEQMLRALHTLSGSAQTVDAPEIVAIVQPLQRAALGRQRLGETFNASQTRYIGDLIMALRARLESLATGESVGQAVRSVEQKIGDFLAATAQGSDTVDEEPGPNASERSLEHVFGEEAGELLARLHGIVIKSDSDSADVRQSLSVLHTLKGSARMAGQAAIADQTHNLEAQVQKLDDCEKQIELLKSGHRKLHGLLTQRKSDDVVTGKDIVGSSPINTTLTSNTLQVSDVAFDNLLDLATDVTVSQARLSDEMAHLRDIYQDIKITSLRWRELLQAGKPVTVRSIHEMFADVEAARKVMRSSLRQAEREQQHASRASASLQQSLVRTRLVRIDEIRERLIRVIRDAAAAMSCQAHLELHGGELTLDRVLFRQLLAPLDHLARNAVVHGIEGAAERVAAGKPASGKVTLAAVLDGTDLVLTFSDDGRGIERSAINNQLQTRGQPPLETHEDLHKTLFTSGFSSVVAPTELAGHGLGLSAVQLAVEQLGGTVQLATEPGDGLQITLRIPQRIVVNQVVLVESQGALFALPVSHIDAVQPANAEADALERYERMPLSRLLSQGSEKAVIGSAGNKATVLVSVGGKSLALETDRIIGYRELVIQALGPQLASLRRFTGGSVLSDARQVLIVDLNRTIEALDTKPPTVIRPARESLRPAALIVDDSLTMRVAAETVLQRCGIAVRQSRDGIEALDSLAIALPNLIVLDIEMPRLNGVDFLQRIRNIYGDACPPVIVTSSRDDTINREHISSLGVVRFLTKPYTESQLLEAVEKAGLRLPDLTIA